MVEFDADSIRSKIVEKVKRIERSQIDSLSLYVFVLIPSFFALFSTIDFEVLINSFRYSPIVQDVMNFVGDKIPGIQPISEGNNWDTGDAVNDDDGLLLYRTLLSDSSTLEAANRKIAQISFIILIGQIINNTNKRVVDQRKIPLLLGTVIYLVLLVSILGPKHELLSILILQVLTLASYTLIVPAVLVWIRFNTKNQGDRD